MDTIREVLGADQALSQRRFYDLRSPVIGAGESVLLHRAGALLTQYARLFKPLPSQREFTHEVSSEGVLAGFGGTATAAEQRACRAPADVAARTRALSNAHIPPRVETPCLAEVWKGSSLVQFRRPGNRTIRGCAKRGRVGGFSRQSRGRMMGTLAKVKTAGCPLPFFSTRTFPDHVPPPSEVPEMDDRYFKRLHRRFPKYGLFWKREIMDRKSGDSAGQWVPHFHEMIWNVSRYFAPKAERGEWIRFLPRPGSEGKVWETWIRYRGGGGQVTEWAVISVLENGVGVPDDCFDGWMARNWYEVVGSGDLYHYSLDGHGRRHGTQVSLPQDGQGVRNYATKPMRYLSKEEEVSRRNSPYFTGARSWGVRGGANIPWGECVMVPITEAVFNCLMRLGALYIRKASKRVHRFRSRRVFVGDPVQWLRAVDYFVVQGDAPF